MQEVQEVQIEQIQAMRMGVDYKHQISIRDFTIFVRPITIAEVIQVAQIVTDRFEKLPVNGKTRLAEHTFLAQETLVKASKPSPDSKVEPNFTHYIMNKMTPDELSYLHKQYVGAMDKVNPSLESLPLEKVKEMVKEVKKNPSAAIELSLLELVNTVRYLVTNEDLPQDK